MKVLLLSNWSVDDGIARATMFPLIEDMAKDSRVEKIYFCTFETKNRRIPADINNALHIPLKNPGAGGFVKLFSFFVLAFTIRKILKKQAIDFVWCRGATAGALGVMVNLITNIRFVVDSFEPHSDYMLNSGSWTKEDPKYRVQRWLEALMKRRARLLLPVSYKFSHHLVSNGFNPSKLFTFPCVVNLEQFKFNKQDRDRLRSSLQIAPEMVVGIYTGKFGGLYYAEEAFELYERAFQYWKDKFFLIILTEMNPDLILEELKGRGICEKNLFIRRAKHSEVPQYLSAADFAFSSIKSVPAMQYSSPIKHGEYWAADLPVFTTLCFGDDADILRKEERGVIIDVLTDDAVAKFDAMQRLIDKGRGGENRSLALKYRNPLMMKEAIEFVVSNVATKEARP
jgi:hypothetical protein